MFLASLRKSLKFCFSSIRELAFSSLGWMIAWPLSLVIPRNRKLAVVLGRDGGKFLDNCKHFFVYASQQPNTGVDFWFLAADKSLAETLSSENSNSTTLHGIKGRWLWLRAGTIFVDSVDWMVGWRYAGSSGARVVQMWHGIPLKKVQLARFHERSASRPPLRRTLLKTQVAITGRFARTDWLLSTSPLVTNAAFRQSFRCNLISHAGYPRNDALFDVESPLRNVNTDKSTRAAILSHRTTGSNKLVGVYAPTFRAALTDPFIDGTVELNQLSTVCDETGILLLLKLHPWMHGRVQAPDFPNLKFVSPESDLYPILPRVDFLITDYSSIFFDFLLLDRPIIFFPYDLGDYLANERSMYFDYWEMTPGPKARDMESLTCALKQLSEGQDEWTETRRAIRSRVFQHSDGRSAQRLLSELFPSEAS